ncbi:MAG: PAS domain S-box protein, partial [Variovorax sp.]
MAAGLLLAPEGIVDELGPGAVPYVTVFSRSAVSSWTVAIALPRGVLNAALWRSLAWIALGALGMFTLGLALVRAIGSHIERSIRGLVPPAVALGYGEPVTLPPLHLRETRAVGHALVQAAALLHERTRQRDDAERDRLRLSDAKQDIERSEAFLRGIFEETPDGVLLVGLDCRVTRANAQGEQLFGYAQGTLAGTMIDDLLVETGPQARPLCERVCAAPMRRGVGGTAQLHGRRRDVSSFPADAMASPLR